MCTLMQFFKAFDALHGKCCGNLESRANFKSRALDSSVCQHLDFLGNVQMQRHGAAKKIGTAWRQKVPCNLSF